MLSLAQQTNQWGTSYRSRLTEKEFVFAGKTGTSQVRRFTEETKRIRS